jgi:CDP-diacylglycerol--glycerol-3-phosphate 3-phosphatidyltransferase
MAATGNKTRTPQDPSKPAAGSLDLVCRDALNLPNLITVSRLLLAIVLFVLIFLKGQWITAAVLFAVAASTDALDGYIARRYGMVTTLGRILDPFVDKIIICGAFIFLLEKKSDFDSGVNAWMVIIVIGREMFVTSLRGFLEKHGCDFSASTSGKIKMVLQCAAVTAALLSLSPHFESSGFNLLRDILLWTAVAATVYSGADYVFRAVRLLRSQTDQPG